MATRPDQYHLLNENGRQPKQKKLYRFRSHSGWLQNMLERFYLPLCFKRHKLPIFSINDKSEKGKMRHSSQCLVGPLCCFGTLAAALVTCRYVECPMRPNISN